MEIRRVTALTLAAALLGGPACSPPGTPAPPAADSVAGAAAPATPASFVNRVWVVADSSEARAGEMRVFLSDGTLVITSPHGTPALGGWRVRDGELTITEEGRDYPVDVLELGPDVFHIRIRGPGEPVDIRFAPAGQSAIELKPPARP